jgi:hypothetical protein
VKLRNPLSREEELGKILIETSRIKDFQDDLSDSDLIGDLENTHHRYDRPSLKNLRRRTERNFPDCFDFAAGNSEI